MSLKAELQAWSDALVAYDACEYDRALEMFSGISDTSKILFNIGLIYATIGEHETAVEMYQAVVGLDQYLAIAYFQSGVSNFLIGKHQRALLDFESAMLYLRSNQAIDYEQLGLKFKLYTAEVLFNKGISKVYLGDEDGGLADMREAANKAAFDERAVIDDAIRDRAAGYTVFSVPVGVLFRPNQTKVRNLKQKDYMGKAKVIAAEDLKDVFTTFTGITRQRQGQLPTGAVNSDFVPGAAGLSRSQTVTGATAIAAAPRRSPTMDNVPLGGSGGAAGLSKSATVGAQPRQQGTRPPPPRPPPPPRLDLTPARPQARAVTGSGAARLLTPPDDEKPRPAYAHATEVYDDYLNAYRPTNDADRSPVPNMPRLASWTRKVEPALLQRLMSARLSPNSSSAGRRPGGRTPVMREDDRYQSDGDFYGSNAFELTRIRIKLFYRDDVRGMIVNMPQMSYDEFISAVLMKFNKCLGGLRLKYKDEDSFV